MTTPLTADHLDDITVDLIFALRDSLTDVSRLDFWAGRCTSAIQTAAAGASTFPEAVTIAARKLQIDVLTNDAAQAVTRIAKQIDGHMDEWVAHVGRNIVYIVALANVARDSRKKPSKKADQITASDYTSTLDTEKAPY